MAYNIRSLTSAYEAIATLTNKGREALQYQSSDKNNAEFNITHYAFHDKDVNYQMLNPFSIDENDSDILDIPIPEPNEDQNDQKYDEVLFPGTLFTDKIDYGWTPELEPNQLTDEEIQQKLKRYYVQGFVKLFNPSTGTYSVLTGIKILVRSSIATFRDNNNHITSKSYATSKEGVWSFQNILESSNITLIPQAPDDDPTMVFTPASYTISVINKSWDNIEFIAQVASPPTTYRIGGTIFNQNGTPLLGQDINMIFSPGSIYSVDKSTGTYLITGLFGTSQYVLNAFNTQYQFLTSTNSISGYQIASLTADMLNLNFTAVPVAMYPLKVSGYVRDTNNVGVAGIKVYNSQRSSFVETSSTIGQEGYYEINNLSGWNSYVFSVWPEDKTKTWDILAPFVYTTQSLTSNRNNVNFTVEPYKHKVNVSGKITDPNSNPIAGVDVYISPEGKSTTTNAFGDYLFNDVNKNQQQQIFATKLCHAVTPSSLTLTIASMSGYADGATITGNNFSASSFTVNINGVVLTGSNPLTQFMIRKEGVGTLNNYYSTPGGNFSIDRVVLAQDYTLIPVSTQQQDYDFSPKYVSLNSFTGSSAIQFTASQQTVGTSSYSVTINLANGLTRNEVKPFVNKKQVNDRIAISDPNTIVWNSNTQCVLYLNQGNYYVSLDGDNYKPLNSLDLEYDSLTANLTATLSAAIDVNSYTLGGYVLEGVTPLQGITMNLFGRTITTDANGYYFFTDVVNSPCTLPAVIMPNNLSYVFSPTQYSFDITTLTANRIDLNFDATKLVNQKLLTFNLLRSDSQTVNSDITFNVNGTTDLFVGGTPSLSMIVPISATGYTVNPIISSLSLIPNNTVLDKINFGANYEKYRENPLSTFVVPSFTGTTSAIDLVVDVKPYYKLGGYVYSSTTATPYNSAQYGSLLVRAYDGLGKSYTTGVDQNGYYEFDSLQSATLGKDWYLGLLLSNNLSVSSYDNTTIAYDLNFYQKSLTANYLMANFITGEIGVSISGSVRDANSNLFGDAVVTLDTDTYGTQSITASNNVLGSGLYKFVVPSGTIIRSLTVTPKDTQRYSINSFTNTTNNTNVYSLTSGLTANATVDWVLNDNDVEYTFEFKTNCTSTSPFSLTTSQNQAITNQLANNQQVIVSSSTSSANNLLKIGDDMYDELINNSLFINFKNYYINTVTTNVVSTGFTVLSSEIARKLNYVFGGIYVLDAATQMTINHWNIEAFLNQNGNTAWQQLIANAAGSTGTGGIGANILPGTGVTQIIDQDLQLIKSGYRYLDIIYLLNKYYDSLYLVVDARQQKPIVIEIGNAKLAISSTNKLIAQLATLSMKDYSIVKSGRRWSLRASQSGLVLVSFTFTDATMNEIVDNFPTLQYDYLHVNYGIDFNEVTFDIYNIVPQQNVVQPIQRVIPSTTWGDYTLKAGDIDVNIYEYNPTTKKAIKINRSTTENLICGLKSVGNYKYVINSNTHPGLQKGKVYIVSINYSYTTANDVNYVSFETEYDSSILPSTVSRYYVKALEATKVNFGSSSWSGLSIPETIGIRMVGNVDTSLNANQIDDTDDQLDMSYKVCLGARTNQVPSRKMVVTTERMNNYVNSCNLYDPPADANYWLAWKTRFMKAETISFGTALWDDFIPVQSLTGLRNNLQSKITQTAFDQEIDTYYRAINNITINAIVAYRTSLQEKYWFDTTPLSTNQQTYTANTTYKLELYRSNGQPVESKWQKYLQLNSTMNIVNDYTTNYQSTMLPIPTNGNNLYIVFNENIKSLISEWVRENSDELRLRVYFKTNNVPTSQLANVSDELSMCFKLVNAGQIVTNTQNVTLQGSLTRGQGFKKSTFGTGNTSTTIDSYLFIREFTNFDVRTQSINGILLDPQRTDKQFDFVSRRDYILLNNANVAAYKSLIDSEFTPYKTTQTQNKLHYGAVNTNISLGDFWKDNVEDWLYVYDTVLSKLPQGVLWSSELTVRGSTSQGTSNIMNAFNRFIMYLPNKLKYLWKYNQISNLTGGRLVLNWDSYFDVSNIGAFPTQDLAYAGAPLATQDKLKGMGYTLQYDTNSVNNKIITSNYVTAETLLVPVAQQDSINSWTIQQMQIV